MLSFRLLLQIIYKYNMLATCLTQSSSYTHGDWNVRQTKENVKYTDW